MTSEKRAQKFHSDDLSRHTSGWCFWLVEANFPRRTTNQKHSPDLGSDTLSVWNFCLRSSDVIWRENQWRRGMSAVFSGFLVHVLVKGEKLKRNKITTAVSFLPTYHRRRCRNSVVWLHRSQIMFDWLSENCYLAISLQELNTSFESVPLPPCLVAKGFHFSWWLTGSLTFYSDSSDAISSVYR